MTTAIPATDIDLVLVTGAGASREFGANHTRLPLMGDWANFLVEKLFRYPYYQETSGLKQGMSGPEFETRLGEFLSQVEGFYRAEGLIESAAKFQPNPPVAESQLVNWYRNAKSQFEQITSHIHASLYEQFNDSKLNWMGAAEAYGQLLHH